MRRPHSSEKGVSLIEILSALALFTAVLVAMTNFMAKSSKSIVASQYRTTANNVAGTALQQLTQTPYDLITPTPVSGFQATNTKCDCSIDTLAGVTSAADPTRAYVATLNHMTYNVQICVNQVQRASGIANTWQSNCYNGPNDDTGLKNILILVTWKLDASPSSVQLESVISK